MIFISFSLKFETNLLSLACSANSTCIIDRDVAVGDARVFGCIFLNFIFVKILSPSGLKNDLGACYSEYFHVLHIHEYIYEAEFYINFNLNFLSMF